MTTRESSSSDSENLASGDADRAALPPQQEEQNEDARVEPLKAGADRQDLPRRSQLAAVTAAKMPCWQPIETLPDPELDCYFWVVPKTPEEAYVNTSGDPIFGTFKPHIHRGKSRTWSSLSKATHWMPLPAQPEMERTPGEISAVDPADGAHVDRSTRDSSPRSDRNFAEAEGAALRLQLQQLIVKWRAEGARVDTFHATMGTGYHACADDLDAALKGVMPSEPERHLHLRNDASLPDTHDGLSVDAGVTHPAENTSAADDLDAVTRRDPDA